MPDDDDKVWVTGLDERFPETGDIGVPKADLAGQPSGPPRRGPDRGLLLAMLVGVVVGVAVWFALLRPEPGPEPVRYVVEKGDTLWHIARFHGVGVDDIQAWNELQGDALEVGQVLLIYPPGTGEAVETHTRGGRKVKVSGGRMSTDPSDATGGALRMPAAMPCLPGPDQATLGEDGPEFAASAGLSYTQTRDAMAGFLPELGRCVPEGGAEGTVQLELTVGCSGRVAEVRVVDGGGLPGDMLSCVRDTLRYVAFPAHDMPDGFTFSYPMTFDAGE